MLNLNQSEDKDYRFKMDPIKVIHRGGGQGCWTYFDNLEAISSTLNHNPKTLVKYMSLSLGTTCNETELWIQGHHSNEIIQKIIFDYIKAFIQCPSCSIPELNYKNISKKKTKAIEVHCLGCGKNNIIESSTLSKTNKKILDKIIIDIDNDYFESNKKTTALETEFTHDEFLEEFL